jgi:hypothetical protein
MAVRVHRRASKLLRRCDHHHCGRRDILQLASAAALGRDPPMKMGGKNGCELPIAFFCNEASVR